MSWIFSRALLQECAKSPCLPAPVAESLAGICSAGKPFAQLNVMPTVHPFWRNDKTMELCGRSPFGLTCAALMESLGLAVLTWFREGFPVRTSAWPDRGGELMDHAQDSGHKWSVLLVKYDQNSSGWKTAQLSLLGDSDESLATWPRSGMTRNGYAYLRPDVAHPISATASGYWQTPVADDSVNREHGKINSRGEPKLSAQVMSSWPTPTASDGMGGAGCSGRKGGLNIRTAVAEWPTPTVSGNYNRKGASKNSGDGLATAVNQTTWPTPTATSHKGWSPNHNRADTDDRLDYSVERQAFAHGQQTPPMRLNPDWTEWLMGWPIGWTELSGESHPSESTEQTASKPSATARFREWLQQHSISSTPGFTGEAMP